jgi:hypothetical protein
MLDRTPIAMSLDIDEDVESVTGFVRSIEEDADAVPTRWRITIRENDSQRIAPVVSFLRPGARVTLGRDRSPSSFPMTYHRLLGAGAAGRD